MITKGDITRLKRIFKEALEERAPHIASIFKGYDSDFEDAQYWDMEYDPTDPYLESGFRIYCSGVGMCGDDTVSFDAKWLSATDDELNQHVQDILDERQRAKEERERRLKEEEEKRQERKLAYYETLCYMSRDELLKELGVPEGWIKNTLTDR